MIDPSICDLHGRSHDTADSWEIVSSDDFQIAAEALTQPRSIEVEDMVIRVSVDGQEEKHTECVDAVMVSEHLPFDSQSSDYEPAVRDAIRASSQFTTNASVHEADLDFEPRSPLGMGSIAVVHKAKLDNEDVAVKVLLVDDSDKDCLRHRLADMERELASVKHKFEHPNITQFLGAGTLRRGSLELPMIVYEHMGGGSVEQVFEIARWIPPRSLRMGWCEQLFSALAYLHTCATPMAHRDLKPANLLLSGDLSTLKIADFSLACPLGSASSDISQVPSIAGSLRYMAPEVLSQRPFALAQTDVYSATLCCWTLCTGQRPFAHIHNAVAAATCAAQGLRPPVRDPHLASVFSSGWHVDPRARPTASEMLELLKAVPAAKKSVGTRILHKLQKLTRSRSTSPEPLCAGVLPRSSSLESKPANAGVLPRSASLDSKPAKGRPEGRPEGSRLPLRSSSPLRVFAFARVESQ